MTAVGVVTLLAALLLWPAAGSRRRLDALRREIAPVTAGTSGPVRPYGLRRRGPSMAACGLGLAVVLVLAVMWIGPVLVAVALVVAATVWLRWRRSRTQARAARARGELLRLVEAVGEELSSGGTVAAALGRCAPGDYPLLGSTVGQAARRARLGASVAQAFTAEAEADVHSGYVRRQLRRLGGTWSISERRGIALTGLMEMARDDLVARAEHHRTLSAQLAGPRATAVILAVLPLIGIGLGQLMGARPLAFLLADGLGAVVLLVGVVLVCAGLLWTDALAERATS